MNIRVLQENKTNKIQRVHFTIEGEWFSWMLRHLWVEGNEIKAIQMWNASFPDYSSVEYLKGFFLDVVSGKRKFIGENTFQLVKDGTKFWSTTAGDKPNKSFPLLQSWEDVILLKRVKLYLSEIDLRTFRMNRRYGETHEDVGFNTLKWLQAADENNVENDLRNKVNKYYTSLRNISMMIGADLTFELIPDGSEKLNDKTFYQHGNGFKEVGDTGIDNGLKIFYQIMKIITPWKVYFEKKYGYDMLFVNEEYLREICGCSTNKLAFYGRNNASVSEDNIQVRLQEFIPNSIEMNDRIGKIIPGLTLDNYIKGMLKESHREGVIAENVEKTDWTSGYINKDGEFFGCSDINHINFSKEICDILKVEGCDNEKFDAQIYLDKQGWVKISVNRFNWHPDMALTQAQKDTIYDYMQAKKITKTRFNYHGMEMTYEEAFREDTKC